MKLHIRAQHDLDRSWCGIDLPLNLKCFATIDAAVISNKFKNQNAICDDCAKEIVDLLFPKNYEEITCEA